MDEQFIPAKKVVELTSLSRASIDRMAAAGEFVRPIYITAKRKVYPRSAVLAWMNAHMERSCGGGGEAPQRARLGGTMDQV